MLDDTHDPGLESWVESANRPDCDFPIQNLPLGVFRAKDDANPRIGTAIGDFILELSEWLPGQTLNEYMALPQEQRHELRHRLSKALSKGSPRRKLVRQADCQLLLPAVIGDYTDFYASIHHATNVGKMFRPDNPLLPNYKHVPIAYHGRASSIVVSGIPVRRPNGQLGAGVFGPTKELDYELEIGAFLGPGNRLGEPIPIGEANQHIAGLCLLNDWSARDIQRWEYQPLGPFLAKNFATSISPWLITWEALAPFRVKSSHHDVPLLPYLETKAEDALDIRLQVSLRPAGTRDAVRISSSSFREMYWTISQMVAHHTSNGCPIRAGDLIGSGTVSGPEKNNRGCLLELTWKGTELLHPTAGISRHYLEDGDEIILSGYCEVPGFRRIGFGACSGIILSTAA
ncbi:MAG TPA: fumarylacetoacetase [Bryobacteraceae bacterium]|nr:fumarylacetoacetase [Bryobacteraceae bacterium]